MHCNSRVDYAATVYPFFQEAVELQVVTRAESTYVVVNNQIGPQQSSRINRREPERSKPHEN